MMLRILESPTTFLEGIRGSKHSKSCLRSSSARQANSCRFMIQIGDALVRLDKADACIGILRGLVVEALTVGSIEFLIQGDIMVAYINQP